MGREIILITLALLAADERVCASFVAPTGLRRPLACARCRAVAHAPSIPLSSPESGTTFRSFVAEQRQWWKSVWRHALQPRFSIKRASFNEENVEGSRITWVGAGVNLILAIFKAVAGVCGNSAAMVCDAAHSFSDLVSDALTLIALQMGSLPPDKDHPYGHARFEAVGSLAIGWLLLLTSVSFGGSAFNAMRSPSAAPVGVIALVAAVVSIVSKELLFRVTQRVGSRLNSQVIVANAWHHRSDALSSIVAVVGILGAILGVRVLDPLCGIGVAALVGWMGGKIVLESLGQLTDTADPETVERIRSAAAGVEGVLGVEGVRCRSMSANSAIADLSVMVGPMASASSAQVTASLVRDAVIKEMPQVNDVLVRTQTMCPLLSAKTPATAAAALEVQAENTMLEFSAVKSVRSVQVRYINGGELAVDIGIEVSPSRSGMSVSDMRRLAAKAREKLLAEVEALRHVSVSMHLA